MNNAKNARLRVIKGLDTASVLGVLVEDHGFEAVLDSLMDIADDNKAVDVDSPDKVREYFQDTYGLNFNLKDEKDIDTLTLARDILGTWGKVYASCDWTTARIAKARGVKDHTVNVEAGKARSALRNELNGTTNNA